MSTSREIVYQTLAFESPERIAHSFPPSDLIGVDCQARTHATPWRQISPNRWERIDEWGNTWGRVDPTSKGEVTKGVIESVDDLDRYEFPDYSRPEDYQVVVEARRQHPDNWLIGNMPGFTFNIARKMRKLDQYLMDLALEREAIHRFHDRIDRVLEAMIRNYAEAGVDSIMFPEDWGTQTQTLISPKMWREEFYPRFCKLCALAHEHDIRVFMHSCGKIGAIVPDLIQAGVDLFQFDQPDLHGIDQLAKYQETSKITFWSPVDIQSTLQTRDEAIIRAKAREMLDKLWGGRGGLIAGFYPDNASIGLDPKWQEIASEAFLEYGVAARYEKATSEGRSK